MKKNTLPFFSLCLAASLFIYAACSSAMPKAAVTRSSDSTKKETIPVADTILTGRWVLQPKLSSDTAAGKIPEISFLTEESRFTGNNGCNSMSGRFIRRADTLIFDERILSTKMACMGYNEKPFMDNLLRTNRFKIENGVLTLFNNETVLSTWTRFIQKPADEKV